MRKFLFNGAILSAAFGLYSAVQLTRKGPRDWRMVLNWVQWAAATAVAVGNVVAAQREQEQEQGRVGRGR